MDNNEMLECFYQDGKLKRVPLTKDEIAVIDPTLRGVNHLRKYLKGTDGNPTPKVFTKSFDELSKLLMAQNDNLIGTRHQAYAVYNRSVINKCGPQGGIFPLDELKSKTQIYYDLALPSHRTFRVAKIGAEYLRRVIRERRAVYGYPQPIKRKSYPTSAGLPTMMSKQQFAACTIGMSTYRRPFFNIVGERDMRRKHRVIFMDSITNVEYVEPVLGPCRNWLKTYIPEWFSTWLNPMDKLYPMITRDLQHGRWFSMLDYEGCDMHFSRQLSRAVIYPLYRELLTPGEFQSVIPFIDDFFIQPLYWGNEAWTGLHNLFSGQSITNDFETLLGVCLSLGVFITMGENPYNHNIYVNGDDVAVSCASRQEAERFTDLYCESSNAAGMVMMREKCSISQNLTFLRRLHYAGSVIQTESGVVNVGAYPSLLVLNQILNPERWTAPEAPEFLVALFSRLDNLQGNPDLVPVIQLVLSHTRYQSLFSDPSVLNSTSYFDWWERVYGTTWSYANSISFRIGRDQNLLTCIFQNTDSSSENGK